jgi:hypothetical protein
MIVSARAFDFGRQWTGWTTMPRLPYANGSVAKQLAGVEAKSRAMTLYAPSESIWLPALIM